MKRLQKLLHSKWFWLALVFFLGCVFWFCIFAYRYTAFLLWGIAGTVGCYDLLRRLEPSHPKAARRLRRLFTCCLALLLLAMAVTEGFVLSGMGGASQPESGYVVVLGAGVHGTVPSRSLRERLLAAQAYLEAYPEALCIVSGGQGSGENISEAQCMYNWLTGRGIDPDRVWMEDQATSTQENIRFSLDLIEAKTGVRPREIAVVSSEYHLYRAGSIAAAQGVRALGVPATTYPFVLRLHYFFREIFGLWFFWIFGK